MAIRKDNRTGNYIADCQFNDWPRVRIALASTKALAERLYAAIEAIRAPRTSVTVH
jgi:hypothetical protein